MFTTLYAMLAVITEASWQCKKKLQYKDVLL